MRILGFQTLVCTTILAIVPLCRAQYKQPELGTYNKPLELYKPDEVGVDEKPGAQVPLDAQLRNEDGETITFGSILRPNRPTILWLGYYECPMLCDKMSAGMVRAVKNIKLDAGTEFAVIQLSINPSEVPADAKAKKESYVQKMGTPGAATAWKLLTANPEPIAQVANAVGYKFKKVTVDGQTQFAHPAVLMILSPEGKVTRYLYPKAAEGVEFDDRTMQLSLIEASHGTIGSTVDRILLTCLHYDPTTGKYTWVAVNLMKVGGAITIVIMASILIPFWIRGPKNLLKWQGETRDSKTIHQFRST